MSSLSVIVITKNEEHNIRACLESVNWADEILIVDAGSTDATVQLAKHFTQKIFARPWEGYGAARNFALTQATSDWILWLDADERVSLTLAEEIKATLATSDPSITAYTVPRRAYFLGRWIKHCGWYPSRVVRLFRRGTGTFSEHKVHEQLIVTGPEGELRSDLIHFTDPNLAHYVEKFNRYTSLASEELTIQKQQFHLSQLLLRPPWVFIKMYIVRLGFLDGIQGLILCVLSACYVFTKYAKLWERSNNIAEKEMAL